MKKICITNRKLCKNDFFSQIEYICRDGSVYALILREKDLNDKDYEEYAVKCNDICKKYNVLFFINSKIDISIKLNIKNIQLSFKDFLENKEKLSSFKNIGISVHFLKEAKIAENILKNWKNCFLIAGHIFETNSKKSLPPRGINFLKEICDNVYLPVFAIGGINKETIKLLDGINIAGVCMMSEFMEKT